MGRKPSDLVADGLVLTHSSIVGSDYFVVNDVSGPTTKTMTFSDLQQTMIGAAPAVLLRDGSAPIQFPTAGSTVNPQTKAAAVLNCFSYAQPGDLIIIGKGVFDFGLGTIGKTYPPDPNPHNQQHAILEGAAHILLPDNVTIRGMGISQTVFMGDTVSDDQGTNFALRNTTLEDMTLINDAADPIQDGRCVGFDNGTSFDSLPGPFNATLRRCKLWCRDWTIYSWATAVINTLLIEDCEIWTGRVGVACESSGLGQNVTINRSKFYGDASLSLSTGATSDQTTGGLFGVIARGGPIKITDCEMNLIGHAGQTYYGPSNDSFTPRVCGVTDHGGAGSGPGTTAISIYNLRCQITANGSDPSQCFDLGLDTVATQTALRYNSANCWGSAGAGLTKSY